MSVAIFNNTADRDLWKWNWTETWQKDIKCHYFFVCIPANMANLIQWLTSNLYWLWSNVQKPAQWFLHTGLLSLSDRIHSAKTCQSARTKLDPGWFCTILFRLSTEERNQVWKWETGSGLVAFCKKEPGPMILAHWLASGQDAFGQNPTRPAYILYNIHIYLYILYIIRSSPILAALWPFNWP